MKGKKKRIPRGKPLSLPASKRKGCPICGWDDGNNHDPLPHLLVDVHSAVADRSAGFVADCYCTELFTVVLTYRAGLAELSVICADNKDRKLERMDVRIAELESEVREAARVKE